MEYFADHIPLLKPWIDDDELWEVEEVLKSGWISQGPKVKELENTIARFIGAPFAVATNAATTALHLALKISGLRHGDHVIVPAHTCMATVNAILMAGGTPVFADIDRRTFNMEPPYAEAALTDKVRAILVVHQIGLPADLDGFHELATQHSLRIVEDASTAFGAKYRDNYVGSHGNPAVYSLHPRKIISTGEGGMLMLFNEECDERARRLRSAGASISDFSRHVAKGTLQQLYPEPGYNYRLTDIQAAVGIAQMRKAHRMLEMRTEQARFYDDALRDVEEVLPPYVPSYAGSCYSSYCITIANATSATISNLLKFMADRGISCRRGIQSLCKEPYFRESHKNVFLPNTDAVAESTMFLPIYPGLTQSQQSHVISALTAAVARHVIRRNPCFGRTR
jgi:dTDP-4-amino-4,6-dideoxygalactose transaminase